MTREQTEYDVSNDSQWTTRAGRLCVIALARRMNETMQNRYMHNKKCTFCQGTGVFVYQIACEIAKSKPRYQAREPINGGMVTL